MRARPCHAVHHGRPHTALEIDFDPTVQRMRGVALHGGMPFDVPTISEIGPNLWQGGRV
jgi:hypothetical protein